ncbi:MAG: hypothetical protein IPN81_06135 [Nitrosomonadales bacterium]|nr:hypothetical protein [Nitrosomonadales bacterium]MBL0037857.1 hypothetical protein [Nitrosomonadales bacterium]
MDFDKFSPNGVNASSCRINSYIPEPPEWQFRHLVRLYQQWPSSGSGTLGTASAAYRRE